MSKYKTLLFDADMTLFDFDKAERVSFGIVSDSLGIEYSEADFQIYKKVNDGLWLKFSRGEVTQEELQKRRFDEYFSITGRGGKYSPELVNSMYITTLSERSDLLEGALEFCGKLYGKSKMYIVTNGISRSQKNRFNLSLIKGYFDGIFVSEDAGAPKPMKEYFDYVFNIIGEDKRESAVIIGDSLTSDILGGKNAGIDTVWFNPDHKENTLGIIPTVEADSFDSLYNILTK